MVELGTLLLFESCSATDSSARGPHAVSANLFWFVHGTESCQPALRATCAGGGHVIPAAPTQALACSYTCNKS